jgi:hypothetical protein
MILFLSQASSIVTAVPQGAFNLKQKTTMNYDSKLMKLVPAGVVLAAAVFLGRSQERVYDFDVISALFGYGAVIALMAMAAVDYRHKTRGQSGR